MAPRFVFQKERKSRFGQPLEGPATFTQPRDTKVDFDELLNRVGSRGPVAPKHHENGRRNGGARRLQEDAGALHRDARGGTLLMVDSHPVTPFFSSLRSTGFFWARSATSGDVGWCSKAGLTCTVPFSASRTSSSRWTSSPRIVHCRPT